MFTIYNEDGSKRTEWVSKSNAIAAARVLSKKGVVGHYVVNERNCEIVWKRT